MSQALWKNKEKKDDASPTPTKPAGPVPGRIGKLASPELITKVLPPPLVVAPAPAPANIPLPSSLPDVPATATEATPAKPPGGSIADRIKSMNTPISLEPRPVSATATPPAADESGATRRPSIKEMAKQFSTPTQHPEAASLKTPSADAEDKESDSAVRRKSLKIAQLGQGINIAALMGAPPPKRASAEAPAASDEPCGDKSEGELAAAAGELQHLSLSRPTPKKGAARKKTTTKFTADGAEPLVVEEPLAEGEEG